MKLWKNTLLVSGASLALALLSNTVFAEARLSSAMGAAPANVTANVNFQINVPQVMLLRVGSWGATENNVVWNYAFGIGLTNPTNNAAATLAQWNALTATAPAAQIANTDDDADSTDDGSLSVAVFSNHGDVRLTSAIVTDFQAIASGLNKPSLSEISATNKSGNINHAPLNGFSGTSATTGGVTLTNASGVVRLTDQWQYTYTPTVNPAAGTYNAEVQYTLANI